MITDKLVEELLKLLDKLSKLSDLTKKIDGFMSKYDKLFSELQISRICNSHLLQKDNSAGKNAVTNS